MKKTVLLIGERGLVGNSFRNLYKDQYDIIGISSGNKESIFSVSKKIDCIVFLAQSGEYKSPVLTPDLFNTNIKFLFECLNFHKEKGIDLIFFSSGSVYKLDTNQVISESSDLNTSIPTPYVATKLAAELIVKTFKDCFKSIVILRPFFIYGKKQKDNMLITSLYKNILGNNSVKLSGPNGLIFNPIHADDVSSVIDHFLKLSEKGLREFNLAGPEICSLKDVVKILSDICGSDSTIEVTGNGDTKIISKVNIPGWEASIGINDGLKRTFEKNG